jgi:hypothetical protein
VYEEFLRIGGLHSDNLNFVGGMYSLIQLQHLKTHLTAVLAEEDHGLQLPADAFVFLSYQKVDFFFFQTADLQADPPVFYYHEGDSTFTLMTDQFFNWLLTHALYHAAPLYWVTAQRIAKHDPS